MHDEVVQIKLNDTSIRPTDGEQLYRLKVISR